MSTYTIQKPNAPATKKQLFALYCMTRKDHRNLNLTIQQASDLIAQLRKSNNPTWQAKSQNDYEKIFTGLFEAGNKAIEGKAANWFPCGFAWIVIKDCRKGFAKWLKNNKLNNNLIYYSEYEKGISISSAYNGQEMEIKEIWCHAAAQYLRENGIDCTVKSHID